MRATDHVLIAALLATAIAAAGLPAQESADEPAAAKKPWPIVAPDGDWYDAKRLADLVAAMRPLAERSSALKFLRDPVVRAADDESWDKLVTEEMPGARDHALAVAITFALYVPTRGEVVLGPFLTFHLLAKDTKVAVAHHPLLVHELVHVLQAQHFQLPSRMRATTNADEKLVLRSMVEGFATWVEEQVATQEFALANYEASNTRMHVRNGRMAYVRGRDFFARLNEQGGAKAMHDAMRDKPLRLYEFARIAVAKPAKAAQPAAETPPASEPAKKGGGGK